MNRYLNATYLGRDTDETRSSKHPDGRYYKVPMNINEKNIIAYLVVQHEPRYDGNNEKAPTIRCVGWYDLDDPEFGYEFQIRGYDKLCSESDENIKFEHAYVEEEKVLDILDMQVPIPYDYVPNSNQTPFAQNYRRIYARINTELFEMKKRLIMGARNDHFVTRIKEAEENNPELKFESITASFNKKEKNLASKLYDRMLLCIIRGKYSFNDYRVFMRNLDNIIRGEGVLISGNQLKLIIENNEETLTKTFVAPTDRELAGQCPNQRELITERAHRKAKEKTINVNYSIDEIMYYPICRTSLDRHAFQVDGIDNAIGTLGRFIICPEFGGEVLVSKGKRKPRHFRVKELVES